MMRSDKTAKTMNEQINTPAPTDIHSIAYKEPVRSQLAEDVERFLKQGGCIEEVPVDFRADPPKRPENNYGRGSI
jgi:hypothetical protein